MSIKISYKKKLQKSKSTNFIYFLDENYGLSGLKKKLTNTEYKFVEDILKSSDLSKKIVSFNITSKKNIFLISLSKNINYSQIENLGAEFFVYLKNFKQKEFQIDSDVMPPKIKNAVGYFLHGLKLKSYVFEKYKTKKTIKNISINVIGKNIPSAKERIKFTAVEEGTFYTRDLFSEPVNVIHPD